MTAFVLAFVVLMWLPGHLALRLSGGSDYAPRGWSPAERHFAALAISAALMLWSAVSLGLLGLFGRGALIGVAAVPTAVLALLAWRSGRTLVDAADLRLDLSTVVALVLVVAGAVLYAPAFEQVSGGRDPVTYVVSGIHMAREGSWVVQDELVTSIPEEHRLAFIGRDRRERFGHWGPLYLGWYLMTPDTGVVVPQGLPLYPSAIAIGHLLADVEGAVRTTIFLAIAAVVATFFLGRRALNLAAGTTAAALLLVSPAQVWFSRFANAETVAQLLLVIGLYGLLVFRRHGGWAYGLLAGVALGLTWQAHITMIWLVPPLGAILVLDVIRRRLDRVALLSLWAPLTVLGVQALILYLGVTTAYMWGVLKVLRWTPWALAPAIPAVAGVLAGIWYLRRRAATPVEASSTAAAAMWPRATVAGLVVVAAAFAYWIRPELSNAWVAYGVPRLVLVTTFAVYAFAVAGVAILLLDRRRGDPTLCVLAVALAVVVPPLWYSNIWPLMLWSVRRYQTFLPLIFLFAAVPLWIEDTTFERAGAGARRGRRAVGLAVALVMAAMLASTSWAYRGFKEPGDSIALVDEIAAGLEDDAVLIFEARSGWGALDYAAPLAFWKGFDVVWLRRKPTDEEALRDFVRRQTQVGRPVYFFTQGFNYFVGEPRMVPHQRWRVQRRQLEEVEHVLPERVLESSFPLASYRVLASGSNGPLDGRLDVGEWDDIYVGETLPSELAGDRTVRWTRCVAPDRPCDGFFWLPGLDQGVGRITVHAGTIQGSEGFGRALRASLGPQVYSPDENLVVLGEIPIVDDWIDYVFEVPSDWRPAEGEAPRLILSTVPLQPDAVNGQGDTRYLGVLVDTISWQ